MVGPGHQVRMGGQKKQFPWNFRDLPPRVLILVGAGVLVLGSLVVAVVMIASSPAEKKGPSGCVSNGGCKEGLFCASGGCIVLLPKEVPDVWADDIAQQLDTDTQNPEWKPAPTYGERLRPADSCPAPEKAVDPVDEGKILPRLQARVFDLGVTPIRVYRHLRSQGSIWVGALRFWLDSDRKPSPGSVCTSQEIAFVARGLGQHHGVRKAYIDGNLARAIPSDVDAVGAISHDLAPPPTDAEGFSTLSFDLYPVTLPGQRFHTVVALPLGSEVPAINGQAPTEQRLFQGYLAYYWEHTKSKSHVDFRFRTARAVGVALNISEVKP